MFAKPYKLKSTNTLKNTEKKILQQRVQDAFPSVSAERLKEILPSKAPTTCLRLMLHSDEMVSVYVVESQPMMIETETGLVPTLCALWKIPELLPMITIHSTVLPRISAGAPLYLPGVVMAPAGVGFPMFARGAMLCARTLDNQAAGVVARAAMSSADMLMKNAGVCVETVHVIGDYLCKDSKFSKIERPHFIAADSYDKLIISISELNVIPREEWPSLGRQTPSAPIRPSSQPPSDTQSSDASQNMIVEDTASNGADPEDEEQAPPADMDGLLRWCLLLFMRLDGKDVTLPLKTNLLYKNYLFPLCPPDKTLDVKKSTYKKMGKFLEAMQREGLLEIKELEKGVDAVVSLSLTHPCVRGMVPSRSVKDRRRALREEQLQQEGGGVDYAPPTVREMFCVTAAVGDLFPNVRRGTAIRPPAVRTAITTYVSARELTKTAPKGQVTLDTVLAGILGKQEQNVKWDALMSGVTSRMTAATELQWGEGGETKLIKTKLLPVTMSVVTRSGNKKVTLVSNLEAFGFNLQALASVCQHGVGAAAGVTRTPGAKYDQLMLQGDQTYFIAKLLVEKYGLPKKFVEGADKALAKKK